MHYYSDSSDDGGNDSDGSAENFLKPAPAMRKPVAPYQANSKAPAVVRSQSSGTQ